MYREEDGERSINEQIVAAGVGRVSRTAAKKIECVLMHGALSLCMSQCTR
jgi:hypothetical protein